ncbi:MAG: hypothetical protein MI700_14335 [Balneolales bacterium]|nr:hypothetical protein [Balneolales bacterium]
MKNLVVVFCFCVLGNFVFAQEEIEKVMESQLSRVDSVLNDFLSVEDEGILDLFSQQKNFQFLYFRTNYDNKTFYAGREIGDNQYNLSGQLFYMHSKGFYAGLAGAWYSQLDPGYRTTVMSFGYGKGLKKLKFLRYRASFDLYFYNNNDPDYDPVYTSSINLGTSLKSKVLSTRFDATFLLGKEIGTQLNWDIYSKITLLKFGKFNKLRIEPELSFYFGSETVEYDLSSYLQEYFGQDGSIYYYEDVFGLLNTQLSIPLTLSLGDFDFEASWTHNLPRSMNSAVDYPSSSLFSFSVGYIFSL